MFFVDIFFCPLVALFGPCVLLSLVDRPDTTHGVPHAPSRLTGMYEGDRFGSRAHKQPGMAAPVFDYPVQTMGEKTNEPEVE